MNDRRNRRGPLARGPAPRASGGFEIWTARSAPAIAWPALRPKLLVTLAAALALVATLLPAGVGHGSATTERVFPPPEHVFDAKDIPEFTIRAVTPDGSPYTAVVVAEHTDGGQDHEFLTAPAGSGETSTGRPVEQLLPGPYTWTATPMSATGTALPPVFGSFSVAPGVVSDTCDPGPVLVEGLVSPLPPLSWPIAYVKVRTIQPQPDLAHICLMSQLQQEGLGGTEPEGIRLSFQSSDGSPIAVETSLEPCQSRNDEPLATGSIGGPNNPIGHYSVYGDAVAGVPAAVCLGIDSADPAANVEASVLVRALAGDAPLIAWTATDTVATPHPRHWRDDPDDDRPSSQCQGWAHSPGPYRTVDGYEIYGYWPIADLELAGGTGLLLWGGEARHVESGSWSLRFCVRVEGPQGLSAGGHVGVHPGSQVSGNSTVHEWTYQGSLNDPESPCPVPWVSLDQPTYLRVHTSVPGVTPTSICYATSPTSAQVTSFLDDEMPPVLYHKLDP